MGRFGIVNAKKSCTEDNNDTLSLSSWSSTPAAFEFDAVDSSSLQSVAKNDINDQFDGIKKDANDYDGIRNALDAYEDQVKAKMAEKDQTIAELSAELEKYAQLVDKTQKMNEEMPKKTINEIGVQVESVPPAGYYYLKAAPELGATNAESKTPSYYRSFYNDNGSWTVIKEDEEIGFGPFPASGLFKLLYHPNGTSVVLASLQYVVLAHKETNMLSLEGFLKKDADVKFVPKKAYFRIIQQRQGSNIFVLQSEINPSASMEVIFEPREMHSHRFASLPFGAKCRIRIASFSMSIVSGITHNRQSGMMTYFPCDFIQVPFTESVQGAVFKLIYNDDETVSLQVRSPSKLGNNTTTWIRLANVFIRPASLKNYSWKEHWYLMVDKPKKANIMSKKFELLVDKSNGSVRLFPVGTDHFVGLFGPHKKYWKPSDATEFFLEEI